MGNEPTTLEFSTSTPRGAVFDEWAALMNETYFPLTLEPIEEAPTFGRVTSSALPGVPGFSLTTLAGRNQHFRRTKTHVAAGLEEYLLVSIQISGHARLTQRGRSVTLLPGQMTILDTSLPSVWDCGAAFEQVLVQVPTRYLRDQPGLEQIRIPAATAIEPDSPPGVVATYFRELARIRLHAPAEADLLAGAALGLLGSAVLLAAGDKPVDTPADALSREHVTVFLREHYTDPDLSAAEVAAACHISRRTLFRLFDGPGASLNDTLRGLRVRHAERLLTSPRTRPLAAVAFESGFASERHFYRVFQQETGMTPRDYRNTHIR
ncbi:helix-turn-helix domain-containing protein [Nocardia sp. NPDC059177]|uniref:helix-turn-helix domain-containing protein n=1 Tax=Nocardia sp. NPDC059177 TaxID=3346759 RepID=UPI0036CB9F03